MLAMKRLLIGSILVAAAVPAVAQDDTQLVIHAGLEFATKDVWRGINLVDESVMTANVHFSYGNWVGFFSGRMELTNENSYATLSDPTGNFTAFRSGIFYEFDYDSAVDVTLGVLAHQYPDAGPAQTQEIYYGLSFGGVANFKIELMQDVETVKGYYVRASASNAFPAGLRRPNGENQPITIGAHVAYGNNKYNEFYYGATTATMTDLSVWMESSFDLSNDVTATPFLRYTSIIDPDLLVGGLRTNFLAGVKFHFAF